MKNVYEKVLTSSKNFSTVNNKVDWTASFLSNPKKRKRVLRQLRGKGKGLIPRQREPNERFVAE